MGASISSFTMIFAKSNEKNIEFANFKYEDWNSDEESWQKMMEEGRGFVTLKKYSFSLVARA